MGGGKSGWAVAVRAAAADWKATMRQTAEDNDAADDFDVINLGDNATAAETGASSSGDGGGGVYEPIGHIETKGGSGEAVRGGDGKRRRRPHTAGTPNAQQRQYAQTKRRRGDGRP